MPFRCLTMTSGLTPLRSARETSRPMASLWAEAQPPALPMELKSSKGTPCSSSLIVTYIFPQPVMMERVVP